MSDPQKVILLTDGAGLAVAPHALRTDDGRENWTALPIQFASAAALDPNDPQRTIVGKARTHDAFLMRVGASGEVLYAARIGGEDNETITSLAVDASAPPTLRAPHSLDFRSIIPPRRDRSIPRCRPFC